ncbi:MAG: hypothetical protein WBC51_17545 [Vicinamibacterales bacterium]
MSHSLAKLTFYLCLAFALGCQSHVFEKGFYREDLASRVERARKLPLDQQYKLFRYGNDVIHPPLMDMPIPIAERGKEAVPFLLEQLQTDDDDRAAEDILLVFYRMASLGTYPVKSDSTVMDALRTRVASLENKERRTTAERTLKRISEF